MRWTLNTGLTIFAAALSLSASAAPGGLSATISMDKRTLGPQDDVVVRVTMINTTSAPISVLKWQTPFGEIEQQLFDVTRDGVKVPYEGMIAKRGAPTSDDYYLLQPGKSYTATVELSSMYNMSVTGDYSVRFHSKAHGKSQQLLRGDDKQSDDLQSEALSVWVDGNKPRGSVPLMQLGQESAAAAAGLSFSKCTTSQQTSITSAVSAAQSMANDGDAYLAAGKTGPRYTKWFGTYNAGRYATMKQHFAAIKDAFATKPVTVDCGCKKTYYAYVYPTQPYKIYVCKAFWSAPMTGTDSKGGTLVHEMSHFNVVASTDDWVYGQSGAASLAISDPAKAIDNADSHEYFGENTPAQQ